MSCIEWNACTVPIKTRNACCLEVSGCPGWRNHMAQAYADVISYQSSFMFIRSAWTFHEVPSAIFRSVFMLCKCLTWQQWFQSVRTRNYTRWWCYARITFKIVLDKERTWSRHLWMCLAISPVSCPLGLYDHSVKSPVQPLKRFFRINPMFCYVMQVFPMAAMIQISLYKKLRWTLLMLCTHHFQDLSWKRKAHGAGICGSHISFLMYIRFAWLVRMTIQPSPLCNYSNQFFPDPINVF